MAPHLSEKDSHPGIIKEEEKTQINMSNRENPSKILEVKIVDRELLIACVHPACSFKQPTPGMSNEKKLVRKVKTNMPGG
jgi:hypothetical protein